MPRFDTLLNCLLLLLVAIPSTLLAQQNCDLFSWEFYETATVDDIIDGTDLTARNENGAPPCIWQHCIV